jgi:RnfABCDGE-type electron transport complex D subunit
MLSVAVALMPSVVMGVVYFGLSALFTIITAVIFSIGAEVVYRLCGKEKLKDIIYSLDYSSLVTGLIMALILPATWHLYIPALSSIFAIIVVKMFFGGTGNNLVNPAATGRIFAFMSFTSVMEIFVSPNIPAIKPNLITGATSLKSFLSNGETLSTIDRLLGTGVAGCIGETCKIAILLGAIFLAIRGIIKIWLPFITLAVTGLIAVAFAGFDFSAFLPSILSGGLIFAAFFMATDYVTNPATTAGNVIFFAGVGVFTALFRHYSGFETVSFAILLMNLLTPLINKITHRKPFGYFSEKEAK